MERLAALRKKVFESDNRACFIERERALSELELEFEGYTGEDRYARILSELLDRVSTPLEPEDIFAGRAVEALPEEGMSVPSFLLCSTGHMSFNYEKLLKLGLRGMVDGICRSAKALGDDESLSFARNAKTVADAVERFAARYAQSARLAGKEEMAKALSAVPMGPAYDFYSALQSVWLMHFIASALVGSRDYAFGRFDQFMLPFFQADLARGKTEEELTVLLAGFFIKTNEICGRTTHNYMSKPVLCQASKQYVNIGGKSPNVLSRAVLDAACINSMAQPQIVVLLSPGADEGFTDKVFESLSVLTDKMNIYNYGQIVSAAVKRGIPLEVAEDFTYSACCTYDLNWHSYRMEYYVPVLAIFDEALHAGEFGSLAELLSCFEQKMRAHLSDLVDGRKQGYGGDTARREYVLDGIMLSDSAANCRYPCQCSSKYNVLNLFFPGIATLGDSLYVLQKLVFEEKRMSYSAFVEMLKADFAGNDGMLARIGSMTFFGNDGEADEYAAMAGRLLLDVAEGLDTPENFFVMPGFYSLERENTGCGDVGALPNGKKAGMPFSENQSPTYGTDKNGITALLKSVSKLPFDRAFGGGLNLTFSKAVSPEILRSLVTAYFDLGGQHVGVTVLDKDTLRDAMAHPEKYQSLTVRLYGFSEYFVSLPSWQQLAVLNRTEY